jgi:hypothetical protein
MGFFKKIFKGVKKVFKKIGRGIKKVVKGVGKFMNKIGIVGQIALMFIPGVGPMLSSMFKGMGGVAAGALRAMGPIGNSILRGAQFVIGKAGKFITAGKNAFGTITDGIGGFVKEFTKTGLNKLGLDPTKFGFADVGSSTFSEAWGKVTTDITSNASKILDPFKSSITAGSNTTLKGISDSAYHSIADIKQMNPQISDWGNINGQTINLDMDNISNVIQGPSLINRSTIAQASRPSLLSPDTNLLTGEKIIPSMPDSFQGVPYRIPVDETVSATAEFFDTSVGGFAKDVAVSSATSLATQGLMSLAAGDPPEAPDYGYVVNAGNVQVTGAGGAVDYGIGGDQLLAASLRPQATGLYDGTNTYAANLKAFYGLS